MNNLSLNEVQPAATLVDDLDQLLDQLPIPRLLDAISRRDLTRASDGEIQAIKERLQNGALYLGGIQGRRSADKRSQALNPMALEMLARREAHHATLKEMAEQQTAALEAAAPVRIEVKPKTKEERLAEVEQVLGPIKRL